MKRITLLILFYCVKPLKQFTMRWKIRLYNNRALIETNAIACDNYKQILIGGGSSVRRGTVLQVASRNVESAICIGKSTYIGENNNLRAADGIIMIGDNCMISQGVTIVTSNHATKKYSKMNMQPWVSRKGQVKICDDVWIGANAVILPDCTVNEGAVVGAGAIVSKDVPAYAIVCGNPAKVIRYRE